MSCQLAAVGAVHQKLPTELWLWQTQDPIIYRDKMPYSMQAHWTVAWFMCCITQTYTILQENPVVNWIPIIPNFTFTLNSENVIVTKNIIFGPKHTYTQVSPMSQGHITILRIVRKRVISMNSKIKCQKINELPLDCVVYWLYMTVSQSVCHFNVFFILFYFYYNSLQILNIS